MAAKLTNLTIELHRWGELTGKYTGTVEYEGQSGSVKLALDPSISEEVLAFIGPVMAKAAMKVYEGLEANLQQSIAEARKAPQIEA